MRIWDEDSILAAIAALDGADGQSVIITLETPEDAESFRQSLYNYHYNRKLNWNYSTKVSGCDVIVQRVETKSPLEIKVLPC